jgi:hypothetical protein
MDIAYLKIFGRQFQKGEKDRKKEKREMRIEERYTTGALTILYGDMFLNQALAKSWNQHGSKRSKT